MFNEEDLAWFDAFVKELYVQAAKTPRIVEPQRLTEMCAAEKMLRQATLSQEIQIDSELTTPEFGIGGIRLTGEEIAFSSPVWLALILLLSDHVEFYPRTDGRIVMSLTFGGVTVPLPQKQQTEEE